MEHAKGETTLDTSHGGVVLNRPVAPFVPRAKEDAPNSKQANGPEYGAKQDASFEGNESHWIRYPRPRTVSMNEMPSLRRRRAMNTSTVFESRSRSCA